MVTPLASAIMQLLMAKVGRILDASAIGMPTENQQRAYRKVVLDEFGDQRFLPELEALLKLHGMERHGRAKTAGKEVPP